MLIRPLPAVVFKVLMVVAAVTMFFVFMFAHVDDISLHVPFVVTT